MTSAKNSLIKQDLINIGKTAFYVGGSAAATYLIQALTKLDWGIYSPLIMGGLNILAVLVKKYLSVNNYNE
jgi:hypothetical protein